MLQKVCLTCLHARISATETAAMRYLGPTLCSPVQVHRSETRRGQDSDARAAFTQPRGAVSSSCTKAVTPVPAMPPGASGRAGRHLVLTLAAAAEEVGVAVVSQFSCFLTCVQRPKAARMGNRPSSSSRSSGHEQEM